MRPINPLNENFNPEQHEAVGTVKQKNSEENSVIEVLKEAGSYTTEMSGLQGLL